jgi:beta-lactamase class A
VEDRILIPDVDLSALTRDLAGLAGVILHDPDSGAELALNPDERFRAASLIKLPLMWHFYASCADGLVDPEESILLTREHMVPGFGVLRSLQAGLALRLRDLAALMIVVSDNTATNLLIDRLGIEPVNATIAALGMNDTVLMRKMYDYRDPGKNNYTTPRDVARFYRGLLVGGGIVAPYHTEMMATLLGQQCRNKLPSGLVGWPKIAHKTGDDEGIEHDAGIFFGDRRRLIVVVMTKDLQRNTDGVALCRRIGEIAYQYVHEEGTS